MINFISIKDFISEDSEYVKIPFYFHSQPVNSSFWGMTLLKASSMRFRWNEKNPIREKMLQKIANDFPHTCSGSCVGEKRICDCKKSFVPIELIHSKDVIIVENPNDTKNLQADGIITKNKKLIPVVTVADCVPIFLFDNENGVFGSFHSGWKGTGIVGEGIRLMKEKFGSKVENISAAIGAHIGDCCYNIGEERAEYFTKNFGSDCVKVVNGEYKLSLTEANLFVLKKEGILEENIVVSSDCTCCKTFDSGKNIFGSFRRQAAFLPPEVSPDERSKSMTVQAAFSFVI